MLSASAELRQQVEFAELDGKARRILRPISLDTARACNEVLGYQCEGRLNHANDHIEPCSLPHWKFTPPLVLPI